VKMTYKRIADQILTVNRMFSIYLSLVVVSITFLMYSEFEDIGNKILNELIGSLGSFNINIGKSDGGTETQTTDESTNAQPTTAVIGPEKVRLIVADVFTLLLYVGMFGLTYWQAVKTNDEVRHLHIWLNDLASEPQARLRSDLFDAVSFMQPFILKLHEYIVWFE
jgi:hypothetical protein